MKTAAASASAWMTIRARGSDQTAQAAPKTMVIGLKWSAKSVSSPRIADPGSRPWLQRCAAWAKMPRS
jgi:hypothetical protein